MIQAGLVKNLMASQRFPHALMIIGTSLPSLVTTSKQLILSQECASSASLEGPCLQCAICLKVEKQLHTDIFSISSHQKDITVETLKEGMKWLMVSPSEMRHRYLIIEEAEWMSRSSSNALLKLLEEPPSHARIMFLTSNANEILQTIRSRTFTLRIQDQVSLAPQSNEPDSAIVSKALLLFKINPKNSNSEPCSETLENLIENKDLLPVFFKALFTQTKNKILSLDHESDNLNAKLEVFLDLILQTESSVLNHYGNPNLNIHYLYLYWKETL